jgi:hypothetical protein
MTDPILDRLQEATGLQVEEVIGVGAPEDRLGDLIREFLRFFPEHAHVVGELAEAWEGTWPDDRVVIHGWLLELEGEPVGFTVFHTSLRRQVILQHFVGVEPEARPRLPMRWIKDLADAVLAVGVRDCREAGTELLATLGENQPEHTRAWERFGYITLDIDYHEPVHGRHWREHGPLRFFEMTPQIRLTDAGRAEPFHVVVDQGVRAFLVDHYLLPEDEPTVMHTLDRVAALPDRP